MLNDNSITELLLALRRNDPDAVFEFWKRYFGQLCKVARQRLGPVPQAAFDSEDIALSALNGFFHAIVQGKYPDLQDDSGLWALLVQITWRKAKDYKEKEAALKRSGVRDGTALDFVAANVGSPEDDLLIFEECKQLFDQLNDTNLARVAALKLDGWSNEEIAVEMKYTRRTIQRMLAVIRTVWQKKFDRDAAQ